MGDFVTVGDLVRNPAAPDWGLGQVQSVVPGRITVTFENAGKVVLAGGAVSLERVDPEPD